MIRILVAAAALACAPSVAAAQTNWTKVRAEWNQPMAPFRILGNVQYVGTAGISAYLITSPQGHILIDGEDMGDIPPNKRAVNMVFQSYALYPHMTVAENMGFGLKMTGQRRLIGCYAINLAVLQESDRSLSVIHGNQGGLGEELLELLSWKPWSKNGSMHQESVPLRNVLLVL